MFQIFPGSDNSPVLVIPKSKGLIPLMDSLARKHLKNVSGFLGLNPSLTFHDFRRGGAVWAFQNGVPLEHIMKHGIWKSDAIWTYLSSAVTAVSPVALHFNMFYVTSPTGVWVSFLHPVHSLYMIHNNFTKNTSILIVK